VPAEIPRYLAFGAEIGAPIGQMLRELTPGMTELDVARRFGALLQATVAGATGAQLFAAAAKAYSDNGFPNEELHHHQGGVIACRAREWVAHPASDMVVEPPQAFAWNPTVTGAKVEETVLLHADNRLQVVTASPGWPSVTLNVRGQAIAVPDVLVI
jgi:hypothetical protein